MFCVLLLHYPSTLIESALKHVSEMWTSVSTSSALLQARNDALGELDVVLLQDSSRAKDISGRCGLI